MLSNDGWQFVWASLFETENDQDVACDGVPQRLGQVVVRGRANRAVEIKISLQDAGNIASGSGAPHRIQSVVKHTRAAVHTPVRNRVAHQDRFERDTNLQQLVYAARLDSYNPIALVRTTIEYPLSMQYLECFSHRHSANVQFGGNRRLYKAVAGTEDTASYPIGDRLSHGFRERSAFRGCQRPGHRFLK